MTKKTPDPRLKIWRDFLEKIDRDPLTAVLSLQTLIRKKTGDPDQIVNISDLTDIKDQIRDMISKLENGEKDND